MKQRLIYFLVLLTIVMLPVSCLKEAPETFPSEFNWEPEVAFPVGETSLGMNAGSGFDTTLLEINDSTNYPYWVDIIDIPIEGETSFSFTNLFENSDQINRISIRVNAYNGFPAKVILQAYFTDMDGFKIDSFFTDSALLLKPGSITGDGETVSPSYTQQDVLFSQDRIDRIQNATEIVFHTIIQNVDIDSTLIQFYPIYSIDIQLGAMVQLIL